MIFCDFFKFFFVKTKRRAPGPPQSGKSIGGVATYNHASAGLSEADSVSFALYFSLFIVPPTKHVMLRFL